MFDLCLDRAVTRNDIADVFEEIAVLLELQGENPFKTRAYRTGARALTTLSEPLEVLIAEKRLQDVNGIGDALAKKIVELQATGRLALHEKLRAAVPAGLREMLRVPGLGPKKVRALHERLGIVELGALAQACRDGKVAALEGFGAKTEQKILDGLTNLAAYGRRHLWWAAATVADEILAGLRARPEVKRVELAGSLRRGLETVGDLDFIVAATDGGPVMDWFCTQPGVKEISGRGDTKASVRLETGLQADLRVVPPAQFFYALHHFTGSKEHNVQLRQRALARGLSLSEWGLAAVKAEDGRRTTEDGGRTTEDGGRTIEGGGPKTESEGGAGNRVSAHGALIDSEAQLFAALGLAEIPPELREGAGEIEAAERGALPELVQYEDVRGVFHNHTTASDGRNTLEEMAAAAETLGWDYLGIADHSKASIQAHGLDERRLAEQVAAIRALNESGRFRCRIFAGTECDILPDGRLDFDAATLAALDYVVVSVHSAFALDEAAMTARIIRAIETPGVTMLGHLTGRLLLQREGYAVNPEKIIAAAAANRVVIELNCDPHRLDMDWRLWRRAAAQGVLACINPDAHRVESLAYVRLGVRVARKGWLTKANVLNTRSRGEIESWLAARK